MHHLSRKKQLAIRGGVLFGTLVLCLNVQAAPLATASARPEGLLIGESHEFVQSSAQEAAPRLVLAATDSWVAGSEAALTEVTDLLEEQRMDILMNGTPLEAVKVCQVFYTEKDYKALTLPTVKVTKGVRLRLGPSASSSVITKFTSTTKATLLYQYSEDWCFVEVSGTYRGFVPAKNVDLTGVSQEKLDQLNLVNKCRFGGLVKRHSSGSMKLYKEPDTGSTVLGKVKAGTILEIIDYCETGWYKVNSSYGEAFVSAGSVTVDRYLEAEVDEDGYIKSVRAKLLAQEAARQAAKKYIQAPAGTISGQAVVDYALQFQGVPYVYGGADPSGFDCSGLVYYVYKQFKLSIPRGATSQYNAAHHISKSALQPGDLVLFSNDSSSSIEHVGIYIGNGQFVHAPRTGDVVKVSSLSDSYWTRNYYGSASFLH